VLILLYLFIDENATPPSVQLPLQLLLMLFAVCAVPAQASSSAAAAAAACSLVLYWGHLVPFPKIENAPPYPEAAVNRGRSVFMFFQEILTVGQFKTTGDRKNRRRLCLR
jgi:hypothetical protein